MSLIVAQTTSNGPQVVSDTKVMHFDGTRLAPKTGTLKAIIVDKQTLVSFAGNVRMGLGAVRRFAAQTSAGIPNKKAIGCLQTASCDADVEFIVASSDPEVPLVRIRSARLEELPVAWIGDHLAFEAFQSGRERHRASPGVEVFESLPANLRKGIELEAAMDDVIQNAQIESVDYFCVRVGTKQGEFEYLDGSFIHVGRDIQLLGGDNLVSKMAQPVSEGGYAVSIVTPVDRGVPALGINFPRARLGLLYLPIEFDDAQVIKDVSANNFSSEVEERFGVRLREPMLR